jgi:uncharacterized protein (DUF58 family)
VRATRCTRAIIVAAAALVCTALLLDDPAFLLCGAALLAVPAVSGLVFYTKTRGVLSSVSVTRSVERAVIRQGASLGVEAAVHCRLPPGMQADIRELIPVDAEPETEVPALRVPPAGRVTITYRVIPRVHGTLRLPGVCIDLSDAFYETTADLTAPAYSGPEVQVQPVPYFERRTAPVGAGERETSRTGIFKSFGIRSLRYYVDGDDMRSVDWKLSAKHNKLIVREYSGSERHPALIVIDLPDHEGDPEGTAFVRLINHATGEVARVVQAQGVVSLMIVSGLNTIGVLMDEQKLQRAVSYVREQAHPRHRLYAAYRIPTRNDLRRLKLMVDRQEDREIPGDHQEYLHRLGKVVSRGILGYETPAFYLQCSRLIRRGMFGGVEVYSMLDGDLSHLKLLAAAARELRLGTRVFSAGSYDEAERVRRARFMGVLSVEAVP